MQNTLDQLPDAAAIEKPKNGLLSGANKGTSVIFKIAKDSSDTYVLMRSVETGEPAVSCFVYAGKSTTVHVPQGYYIIAWCSGPYWYGEENLFGPIGSYSKSETVEIKGSRYQHTFTLEASSDGDVSIYNASPEDFR